MGLPQGLIILTFCVSVALMVVSGQSDKWFPEIPIVLAWIAASINVHSFIRLVKPYGAKASVEIKEPSGKPRAVFHDPRNGRTRIRWKRGLFRAWVVFAVLWIAVAAWVQTRPLVPTGNPFQDLIDAIPYRTRNACEEAAKTNPQLVIEACVEEAHKKNWRDANKVMWVLLPPVLILLFGSVVGWAIQGFRP
jgi:hypothetical protein